MKIDVKGRNHAVTDELRALVERRFRKIAAQVPEETRLEVEVREERNPAIAERMVVEARLRIPGRTLCADESSRTMRHAVVLCSEDLARQVKSVREKRTHRREAQLAAQAIRSAPAL